MTPRLLLNLEPLPPRTCKFKVNFFLPFPVLFFLQVSLATFTVYVLLGNELTAGKAFVAISLFNILRFPLAMLPRVVMNFIQVCRACHRTLLHFTDRGQFSIGLEYVSWHACLIAHFTVLCSVTWPLKARLAGGDLALVQSSLLFSFNCQRVSIRTMLVSKKVTQGATKVLSDSPGLVE